MSLVGRLEDLSLSDIFQILSVGRKTGTLVLKGSRGTALIVFKNGLIVRAETDDIDGNIGDMLLQSGLIKDTIMYLALEVKKELPSKSIAEILYDLGSVKLELLEKASKKRIEKVIFCLLPWEDGDFQFEPDDLVLEGKTDLPDLGWEISRGMSPEYLLMEGARVQDEMNQPFFVPSEELSITDSEEAAEEEGWEDEWESPATERRDITALKSLTQELRFPNSASEITLLVLRFASDMFIRGVLFMIGKGEMVGLGQFGLEIERADEMVRATVLDIDKSPFFKKIITEQLTYKGGLEKDDVTAKLVEVLGGVWPRDAVIFPVVAEGRVVAFLYCDNSSGGEPVGETEGLEIFINHAGLALEKSLLQRRLQDMETNRGTG